MLRPAKDARRAATRPWPRWCHRVRAEPVRTSTLLIRAGPQPLSPPSLTVSRARHGIVRSPAPLPERGGVQGVGASDRGRRTRCRGRRRPAGCSASSAIRSMSSVVQPSRNSTFAATSSRRGPRTEVTKTGTDSTPGRDSSSARRAASRPSGAERPTSRLGVRPGQRRGDEHEQEPDEHRAEAVPHAVPVTLSAPRPDGRERQSDERGAVLQGDRPDRGVRRLLQEGAGAAPGSGGPCRAPAAAPAAARSPRGRTRPRARRRRPADPRCRRRARSGRSPPTPTPRRRRRRWRGPRAGPTGRPRGRTRAGAARPRAWPARRMETNSSTSVTVSASECAASDSMAEEPLIRAPTAFAAAMPRFASAGDQDREDALPLVLLRRRRRGLRRRLPAHSVTLSGPSRPRPSTTAGPLPLRAPRSGRMRLLLLADTHVPRRARDLPGQVWDEVDRADVVVHAGDWVEPCSTLEAAAGARGPGGWSASTATTTAPSCGAGCPRWPGRTSDGLALAVVHETGAAQGREARCADPASPARTCSSSATATSRGTRRRRGGLRLLNPGSPTDRRRQPHATYLTAEPARTAC